MENNYFNPNDTPVTTETYEVDEKAYKTGVTVARMYAARGETAHNPFKPETTLWYSFGLGARDLLSRLPDVYLDGPLKGTVVQKGWGTNSSSTFTTTR